MIIICTCLTEPTCVLHDRKLKLHEIGALIGAQQEMINTQNLEYVTLEHQIKRADLRVWMTEKNAKIVKLRQDNTDLREKNAELRGKLMNSGGSRGQDKE
jgi:hypothetical protein